MFEKIRRNSCMMEQMRSSHDTHSATGLFYPFNLFILTLLQLSLSLCPIVRPLPLQQKTWVYPLMHQRKRKILEDSSRESRSGLCTTLDEYNIQNKSEIVTPRASVTINYVLNLQLYSWWRLSTTKESPPHTITMLDVVLPQNNPRSNSGGVQMN